MFSILHTFKKDRNPGPDGWSVEFYLDFFKPLGEDLLGVVEEVRISNMFLGSFNATFIVLILGLISPSHLLVLGPSPFIIVFAK